MAVALRSSNGENFFAKSLPAANPRNFVPRKFLAIRCGHHMSFHGHHISFHGNHISFHGNHVSLNGHHVK